MLLNVELRKSWKFDSWKKCFTLKDWWFLKFIKFIGENINFTLFDDFLTYFRVHIIKFHIQLKKNIERLSRLYKINDENVKSSALCSDGFRNKYQVVLECNTSNMRMLRWTLFEMHIGDNETVKIESFLYLMWSIAF